MWHAEIGLRDEGIQAMQEHRATGSPQSARNGAGNGMTVLNSRTAPSCDTRQTDKTGIPESISTETTKKEALDGTNAPRVESEGICVEPNGSNAETGSSCCLGTARPENASSVGAGVVLSCIPLPRRNSLTHSSRYLLLSAFGGTGRSEARGVRLLAVEGRDHSTPAEDKNGKTP